MFIRTWLPGFIKSNRWPRTFCKWGSPVAETPPPAPDIGTGEVVVLVVEVVVATFSKKW
jgi:hypothetical protein